MASPSAGAVQPENQQQSNPAFELTARSISYTKPASHLRRILTTLLPFSSQTSPPDHILRNISMTVRSGELLAIVGPSGSGKSTLLNILSTHTKPTSGELLLNSSQLDIPTFRRLSAHLPQHDNPLPLLTVSETFTLSARLLLPPSSAASTASKLLSDLRLSHLSNSRLPGTLSGGELRRVSLGLSLLRNPSILLLDEPTSGLDSASALLIINSLRVAASSGRRPAVVLSIHQPSSQILPAFDSFLLLSNGSAVHSGNLHSLSSFLASSGFPLPLHLNPIELALEVLQLLPNPATTIIPPPQSTLTPTTTTISNPSHRSREITILNLRFWKIICRSTLTSTTISYPSPRSREILILNHRFWKIIYRSKQLLLTNTLEALLVGFLLGTIYVGVDYDNEGIQKRLGFFAFTLTFLLSTTTETLPIFVSERPIIINEASAGVYRLSSHLLANTLVFLPYLLTISILYTCSVYFIVGLCASWKAFGYFVLIIWAVILAANSFVLLISAVAPDYIAGTSVVAVALAGFFLFSGYFLRRERMAGYWMWMHYLSPYRYALDGMLENEYGCEAGRCFEWEEEIAGVGGGRRCKVTGREVMEERGLREGGKWVGLQVLLGFFVFYRVVYLMVLLRRAARCKR